MFPQGFEGHPLEGLCILRGRPSSPSLRRARPYPEGVPPRWPGVAIEHKGRGGIPGDPLGSDDSNNWKILQSFQIHRLKTSGPMNLNDSRVLWWSEETFCKKFEHFDPLPKHVEKRFQKFFNHLDPKTCLKPPRVR
jgi:hypothetical protein